MAEHKYLRNVRDQYEEYSFPKRDPRDERKRLISCEMDMLAKVNHYGFAGRQGFGKGFHALVAGGGTGDSAVYLAHQLAPRGGRVTYLDISKHSQSVARERAKVRGLKNIDWVHGSILELPTMGLGPFDYVNCAGVLHHMADPDEGLRALASVVKDDGCLGLMVYGRIGRMDIYATQELMRIALAGEPVLKARVADSKEVLDRLPPNNVFIRGRNRVETLKLMFEDEPNLVDTLLHPQDRAYSVQELYAFTAQAGLNLIEFTNYHSFGGVCRLEYDPALYLVGTKVLDKVMALPLPERQTVAELMNGSMGLHSFYASKRPREATVACPLDPDMVPCFVTSHGVEACRQLVAAGPGGTTINLRFEVKTRFQPHPATLTFLTLVDNAKTMGQLVALLAQLSPGGRRLAEAELWPVLARDFDMLNALNWLVLRHKDAQPVEIVEKTYQG